MTTVSVVQVLHLIARLNDGGPARVLMALAPALRAYGIHTRIIAGVCGDDEKDMTTVVQQSGIQVETLPLLKRATSPWEDMQAYRVIMRRIKQLRPTLVHTHTAKAGALGRVACRVLGVPCVHTYHGHVLAGYFPPIVNWGLKNVERLLAGQINHHALTASQQKELASHYEIGNHARWHTVPIPVVPITTGSAAWHKQLQAHLPVIGFLGRLTDVKDVSLWLDTLAHLSQLMPVQGLICGDGADRAVIEKKIATLQFPVVMTGFVPAAEALHVMDVLLLTSRNEGLPVTVIEAAGAQPRQVPVVAPPVGGLRDLIQAGVVVGADRRAEALAAQCQRLIQDNQFRNQQTAKALVYAQQLAPEQLAGAYADMYHRVAGR